MYKTAKNILKSLMPKKLFFQYEVALRGCFSILYTGKKYQCNVCNKRLSTFIKLSNSDTLCPNCGSLKRNRRLWSILETEFLKPNSTILDFSPSRCLYRNMKKIENINYYCTDLSGDFIADFQYDITKLEIEDNTFDLIICYHILEHIENDILAIKELFRVLKPGAKALVQTPFKNGETYENDTITSDEGRLEHFGQADHVRIYSIEGLKDRIESCGFLVEIRTNFTENNNNDLDKFETIFVITKQ
jgi:SAM-dependent methyltransferase